MPTINKPKKYRSCRRLGLGCVNCYKQAVLSIYHFIRQIDENDKYLIRPAYNPY